MSFVSVPLIALLGTYSMIAATRDGGGPERSFAASGGMPVMVGVGNTASFIVLDAQDWPHALAFDAAVVASYRGAGSSCGASPPSARPASGKGT